MKKKLFLITVILALMLALSVGTVATAYALEPNEVYYYTDESATATFTLKDETNYDCEMIVPEMENVNFSGTYVKQGNRITFYLGGEVFLETEVSEDNTLTLVEDETENVDISELLNAQDIEEWTARIVEWVIAGVLGLLGTSFVSILFRRQLKGLIQKILTALGLLKENKDSAEQDIKSIKENAENTLASLKNVKEEMLEINKEEFIKINKTLVVLSKAVIYLVSGQKELVANGTAETICNLLEEPNKGMVDENAKEEIQ